MQEGIPPFPQPSTAVRTIGRSYEAEDAAEQFRRSKPHGATPLTKHIREIHAELLEMAPALGRTAQQVWLALATDGLPTDDYGGSGEVHRQRFVEALRNLEGLPVWVVIRLCTDDEDVVSLWNDIDAILARDIDVLDSPANLNWKRRRRAPLMRE